MGEKILEITIYIQQSPIAENKLESSDTNLHNF